MGTFEGSDGICVTKLSAPNMAAMPECSLGELRWLIIEQTK